MPITVVEGTKQATKAEHSEELSIPHGVLPDRPVPDTHLKYNTAYLNYPSNEGYHTLFTSRDLPSTLHQNGKNRVGILELPATFDPSQNKDSLITANAILASAIRGYTENIPDSEKRITLIAQKPDWNAKHLPNLQMLTHDNVTRIFKEAFGDLLDSTIEINRNQITFSLRGGAEKITATLHEASAGYGTGAAQLKHAVVTDKSHAAFVLGIAVGLSHSVQIAAENPRTAVYKQNPVTNDSIVEAMEAGVRGQLKDRVPLIGSQDIQLRDIGQEKLDLLQSAFKMGYRFTSEEVEGKQQVKIFRLNKNGLAEDTGVALAFDPPTIRTFKSFAKERAEKVHEVVSKLMSSEPVHIVGSGSSIALRGDALENSPNSPLAIARKGLEKGFLIHYSGTSSTGQGEIDQFQIYRTQRGAKIPVGGVIEVPREASLEDRDKAITQKMQILLTHPPYELTHEGSLLSLIDKGSHPALVQALSSGELKIDGTKKIPATNVGGALTLHSYTYRFKDQNGETQTESFNVKPDERYLDTLQALLKEIPSKRGVGFVTTHSDQPYVISETVFPKNKELFDNARMLGYEIVDLGSSGTQPVFGLRNMTTYQSHTLGTTQNPEFKRTAGVIDLTFSSTNEKDGALGSALDAALQRDAQSARSGTDPNIGARKTEYLTRRNTKDLILQLVKTNDIASLTKNISMLFGSNTESFRQKHTGMMYHLSSAIGEVVSQIALQRGMGEEFAKKVKESEVAIADTLAIAYIKVRPVIDSLSNLPPGVEDAKKFQKERWERLALSIAKMVIDRRERDSTMPVLEPSGRVLGILGSPGEFSPAALRKTFHPLGVTDIQHLALSTNSKTETVSSSRVISEIGKMYKEANGKSLVYLWGHSNPTDFTHIKTDYIARAMVNGAPKQRGADGKVTVDLSKVGVVFDGCHLGGIGGYFVEKLNEEARKIGVTISSLPDTYSSAQRGEYARFYLKGVSHENGKEVKRDSLSLLQESIMESSVEGQRGLVRENLYKASEFLKDEAYSMASGFKFARTEHKEPHLRLQFEGQVPVIFDTSLLSVEEFLKELEQNMNAPQIKREDEQTLKLGKPQEAVSPFMLHLSKAEEERKIANSNT